MSGIIRPFSRDFKSDFLAGSGELAIKSSIGQILGTEAGNEQGGGELAWRPEFGSRLFQLANKRNDAILQEMARIYVVDALKCWLPSVRVMNVEITRQSQDGENILAIKLEYSIIGTTNKYSSQTVMVPVGV